MEGTSQGLLNLPARIQKGLERLRDELKEALGDDLVAIILYGGLAKREELDGRGSQVDLMVVLTSISFEVLDRAVFPLRRGASPGSRVVLARYDRNQHQC